MNKYEEKNIAGLVAFSRSLPEKARRHFIALQYRQLGPGSQKYVAEIFGCSRMTITRGLSELDSGDSSHYSRQRKAGGGRKKKNIHL